MNKEILPPDEAKSMGLGFIRSKYYRAEVTVNEVELVTEGSSPVYQLEGSIKMHSRGIMTKLVSETEVYSIRIKVHAIDGSVLNYELR